MAANEYYHNSSKTYRAYRSADDLASPLHPLPYSVLDTDLSSGTPGSPLLHSASPYEQDSRERESRYFGAGSGGRQLLDEESPGYGGTRKSSRKPTSERQQSDEIPLRENPQNLGPKAKSAVSATEQTILNDEALPLPASGTHLNQRSRERGKKGFWASKTPWVTYFLTLVQLSVFVAEMVKNSSLTQSPIEIHPQINPMLGPSFSVLINMGARYVPCMKLVPGVPLDTRWPCPNTTSTDPTDPSNQCNISDLCGFQPFGDEPNQWFRFIIPIFLHAGIIHIAFNMLLQLTLGREIEKIIGSIRFLVVYLTSGIFGFVLGGNFAASGIASTGASGALFGIIAINLLDLLYTWNERMSPKKELAFILLDIVISFALGLLPGLDNFSHIGGFLMGLVLGICILHSPNLLRTERAEPALQNTSDSANDIVKPRHRRTKRVSYKIFVKDPAGFFKGRRALWWAWWLVRAGALLGALVSFIVLINNFYTYHNSCSWCKYLSCINVNNWCDMGNLTSQITNVTTPHLIKIREVHSIEPIEMLALL